MSSGTDDTVGSGCLVGTPRCAGTEDPDAGGPLAVRPLDEVDTPNMPSTRHSLAATPVLRYVNFTKAFSGGGKIAISGVDLEICEGEFLAVVGPSGCGKSTLLNAAAGLTRPTKGKVMHRGVEITAPNTRVGYLTQHDSLLAWRTVKKNVMLPLEFRGIRKSEAARRARFALDLVGLTGVDDYYPAQLSGGMRQRVAIARILIYNPDLYLLDEPFAALDAQMRNAMHGELQRIWHEAGGTIVLVTHDLDEAVLLADRVIVVSASPGRVKRQLTIDLPRPRDKVTTSVNSRFQEYLSELWSVLDPPHGVTGGD